MPTPAIKGIYQRRYSQCLEKIGAAFRSHHGGTIKYYMSEAYAVCATLMEPDGIVNLLDSALCYALTSNYSCVELEFKSNSGS